MCQSELIDNRTCYEDEDTDALLWGSDREIALSENILSYIPRDTKSLIDIGCGDGYLLNKIRKRFVFPATAFDLKTKRLLRSKNNNLGIDAVQGDIKRLPFKDDAFDTVVCSEVLEHIPDYKRAIREITRIARTTVIITVPNEQELIKTRCPKCGTVHYLSGHINSFSEVSMRKLFSNVANTQSVKTRKFHTIYTYNRLTLRLPVLLRLLLDQLSCGFHKIITFFKPNFLLISVTKLNH